FPLEKASCCISGCFQAVEFTIGGRDVCYIVWAALVDFSPDSVAQSPKVSRSTLDRGPGCFELLPSWITDCRFQFDEHSRLYKYTEAPVALKCCSSTPI